ncbi:MAG: acyl transferase [Sphingobacteriaceae bacterium]
MLTITPEQLFSISSETEFNHLALEIFKYQATENAVYLQFVEALGIETLKVTNVDQIPFLPIELFKTHTIQCGNESPQIVFSSSGTTGSIQSKHPVKDLSIYVESFRKGFQYFYGDITEYTILALLPSYLEREGSSLIYMVDDLINESKSTESGYFLYNHDELYTLLNRLKIEKRKTLLIGVTYALLDFIESYTINFPELIVMETGGMKGKRKEMIREELHEILCKGFGVSAIHSEYGMTELLSQGYSKGNGKFGCPPWMQISIRDTNDPLSRLEEGKTGGINVIDLANLHSCSFLATHDLGKNHEDGSFEILGRFDNSDIRGCNLLIQ